MVTQRTKTLEDKFTAFGKSLPGAEFINDMNLTAEQKNSEKADFLFDDRRIICEVKSLKADMGNKVEKILEPHQRRPEWPIIFGSVGIDEVLKRLPDGELINRQIYDAVTTSIKELVRKANRQIRKTKDVFGLHAAGGLLVLLNDYVEILTPDIIAYKVSELYGKKTPERSLQFPEVNFTWVINEAHFTQLTHKLQGLPSLVLPNGGVPDAADVSGYVDSLHPRWAEYNNVPLIKMDWDAIPNVRFESVAQERRRDESNWRYQELWRNEYRREPNLRNLTTEEFLRYGERFIEYILPGYSEDTTLYQKGRKQRSMRYFTHFLEEMNFRRIRMSELPSDLRALAERLRDEGIVSNEHFAADKGSAHAGKVKVGRNDPCACGSGKKYKKCCASASGHQPESKARSHEGKDIVTQDKQGPVTVTAHRDGTGTVRVNVYALSLAATRKIDEQNTLLDHAAAIAPPPIDSEEEAKEYGLREARYRWPTADGWDHRVEVSLVPLTFEFGRGRSPSASLTESEEVL